MKCVCGYEYSEGLDDNANWGVLAGDKKFLVIKGAFLLQPTASWEDEYNVPLFACPKCGTVKINIGA